MDEVERDEIEVRQYKATVALSNIIFSYLSLCQRIQCTYVLRSTDQTPPTRNSLLSIPTETTHQQRTPLWRYYRSTATQSCLFYMYPKHRDVLFLSISPSTPRSERESAVLWVSLPSKKGAQCNISSQTLFRPPTMIRVIIFRLRDSISNPHRCSECPGYTSRHAQID